MSDRDWNNFNNELQREISNEYNRIYQDNVVTSFDTSYQTTYSNAVNPVLVALVVLGCGSLLFCLIVVCCCCCKRTTRGRVLVPPPLLSEPAAPQVLIHHTYPVFPNPGPSLYPEMAPIPQEYQPMETPAPYKVGTAATAAPEYPPSYDTDRLLHGDANAQPS